MKLKIREDADTIMQIQYLNQISFKYGENIYELIRVQAYYNKKK